MFPEGGGYRETVREDLLRHKDAVSGTLEGADLHPLHESRFLYSKASLRVVMLDVAQMGNTPKVPDGL